MVRIYIPVAVDRNVRAVARNRCGYCLSPQHLILAPLQIEHLIPRAQGGSDDESNLWLSCPICNAYKSDRTSAPDPETGAVVPLFNPRMQNWFDHFRWSEDGLRIIGLTAIGRATVALLHLDDDPIALLVRSYWVTAGWHPPKD
ncbi:MAG TPA: HNH endonuclease signature motif containing protein [Gemmataceae bacterium]|jgi:hypothetical protein|nr:HNH endonuclease signature motif containing protein [Gemmataceae bacterium]